MLVDPASTRRPHRISAAAWQRAMCVGRPGCCVRGCVWSAGQSRVAAEELDGLPLEGRPDQTGANGSAPIRPADPWDLKGDRLAILLQAYTARLRVWGVQDLLGRVIRQRLD